MLVTNFRLKNVLYRVICACYQFLDVGRIHPVRERSLRALKRTVDYIETMMPNAIGFDNQRDLIEYSLHAASIDGYYLEFGVFTGGTIRFMARQASKHVFHGFDSFEGLPEDWGGFSIAKNAFSVRGRTPRVPKNVRIHRGWFEESLPGWLKANGGPVAFIHVDCDLYSSTVTIFMLLRERIVPGTVILFDEYFNYANWEQHEFKAFQEFVKQNDVTYSYLAFARQQVLVRIDAIGGMKFQ
jgi:hypothetical protein